MVSELGKCVFSRIHEEEWPLFLEGFKIYAKWLLMCKCLLYFKKLKDGNALFPIMSLVGITWWV